VENLLQHFPHRIAFDPFTLFPFGQNVPWPPFFDLLLGSLIWIIGLGSPTQHTIETVGAYFPAILGALVTVPVYFIGRELFNRNVGLLAAGLIAILPGQFLVRSLPGFTDHHVAEVLFSTTAALFVILAIKRAKGEDASFGHIRSRDWGKIKKPLIYAILAGFALGIYLFMWNGGLLFIFMIAAYTIIQYIIDHLRGKSSDYLCIIGMPMFLIVLIMVIPFSDLLSGVLVSEGLLIVSLVISIVIFPVLSGISWLMASRNFKRAYYPMALVFIGAVGIALLYIIEPSLYHTMVARFRQIFTQSELGVTIEEAQSLLSLSGIVVLVSFFSTGFFLALIALVQLIYAGIRERSLQSILTFLIIWSLIMLLAMLGQNRFAYYFAVNVALLAGYLCWQVLAWSHFRLREAIPKDEEGMRKFAKSQEHQKFLSKEPKIHLSSYLYARQIWDIAVANFMLLLIGHWKDRTLGGTLRVYIGSIRGSITGPIRGYFKAGYVKLAGMAMIVFLIAFSPNLAIVIDMGIGTVNTAGPNEAWYSSLIWMREHTPDPFEDPDYYYELYESPPAGESYDYPESAYGIMNWWTYGHWITRIAHRIPTSNPFQSGASATAEYFTAQGESTANEMLDELGSKYVIIDYRMSKTLSNMPAWSGESTDRYIETYYREEGQGFITLYYPEYYRLMVSRLYNLDGRTVIPSNSTFVISYEENGQFLTNYKEVTSIQNFATYEEAQEFVESQTELNYRIVGIDPFTSPVPLEELEHYKLIHQSEPEVLTKKKEEPMPYVKIFEYLP